MMKWICSNNTWICDKSLNSYNDYLLSLVTTSSNLNQRRYSLFSESLQMSPQLPKQAPPGEQEGGRRREKEKHNCQKQTRKDKFLYSEVTTRKVCRCILVVTGMSRPWKPSQYNYTPSYLPPAKEVLLEQERRTQIPATKGEEPRGIASLTKPISFAFKYL